MEKLIELTNLGGKHEYCILDKVSGEKSFSDTKKITGFTGLYFKNDNHFFGVYPTVNGPIIYYEGKEYEVNPSLDIQLSKNGKFGKFEIIDYSIEIDYLESDRIGWDVWSDEIDVDLFFMLEQRYKKQEFYDQYTLKG